MGRTHAHDPPPLMVVCDGGTGFEKARKIHWPQTRVQRCTFHAFTQVKRYTTSRPRTQAGAELYGLAKDLLKVADHDEATAWTARFVQWCTSWQAFLAEQTITSDRQRRLTHERLVKARNSLARLVKTGVLFTYVDPDLVTQLGPLPATNNRIESVNARLRELWRLHRGMSNLHRAKAAFWWCYMHTENPLPPAEILRTMPTDNDITTLYQTTIYTQQEREGPTQWGDAIVWADLHHQTPWNPNWN